ncbi:MAG: hypothetical protein ACJ74Q_18020 [Pyrinomonadaceae bacterium]
MRRIHNIKHARLKLAAFFFLLFIACNGTATAQTETASPTPTPKSEEVLRLEEEKAQAVLRKDIAEANKAEREAKFPTPTSSPLAGATTINDGAIIESQIVAYSALARAANRLVGAINNNSRVMVKGNDADGNKVLMSNVSKLAIFNEDDVRLLLSHKTTMAQLEVLRKSYCLLLAKEQTTAQECPETHGAEAADFAGAAAIAGTSIAKSLLGSFVDLTSFLRTNVDIKGQTFDIDEGPLVAEVFRAARRTDGTGFPCAAKLYYPKLFPPDINPDQSYRILGEMDTVFTLRNTAGGLIAELAKNKDDLTKAKTKVENLTATVEQQTAALDAAREKLSNVLIKAHCPGVPECDRDDPIGLDARLRKLCPKLTGEERERIFEQASLIKQLGDAVTEVGLNLTKAKNAVGRLESERKDLLAAFGSGAFNIRLAGNLTDEQRRAANELAVDDVVAQLTARNDQVDKFIAAMVQAGTGGGANALSSLIKAENILAALEPEGAGKSYWLQLKVVKAGGNNRIKTNLVWDIFTGGNRVSHSGGVIVEYILFAHKKDGGEAVASDTITEYTDYIKAGKVRKLPTREEDDMPVKPNAVRCDENESGMSKDKKKHRAPATDGN